MTNDYTVIGYGRDDDDALLLLGDDGQHYAYDVGQNRLARVEVGAGWVVEGESSIDGTGGVAAPDAG